jgi:MFS transporter, ACS family, tartrate transporter
MDRPRIKDSMATNKTQVEQALPPVYARIMWRIVPFLMLLYTIAFLNRVNVGFAALTMNRDLGITDRMSGFAAGVFFLPYCLFQLPANAVLSRVGAGRWLGALMVVWGIVSMGTAFVASIPAYVGARALLGVAESGFYPGVIYYFTFWLPRALRTRALALFLFALPLCNVVGSPISAYLLRMNSVLGLHGWQWLFLVEGVPAVLLGIATPFLLADHPQSATWLSAAEKQLVEGELAGDQAEQKAGASHARWKVTGDSVAYFLWSTGIYGLSFWLPKILVTRGASTVATGWWATLTFAFGGIALWWASRQRHMKALPLLFLAAGAGFAVCGISHTVAEAVAGFCLACMGLLSSLPIFWSVAAGRLSGKSAGAAIAIVNSWGAVGAFAGPYAMGWLHDATHHYTAGLWAIAVCLAVGAGIVSISIPDSPKMGGA